MKFEVSYMLSADQAERQHLVVQKFTSLLSTDWSLRFIDERSHVEAVRNVVENDAYVMIAEDGVEFTPRTEEWIRRCVDSLIGRTWHIAFTEVNFENHDQAAKLFPPVDEMLSKNALQMHGIAGVQISGSRCYLINKWAKHQFLEQISRYDPAQGPFDRFLAERCFLREVLAFVIYPFPTSLSQYPKFERKEEPEQRLSLEQTLSLDQAQIQAQALLARPELAKLGKLAETLAWVEAH